MFPERGAWVGEKVGMGIGGMRWGGGGQRERQYWERQKDWGWGGGSIDNGI